MRQFVRRQDGGEKQQQQQQGEGLRNDDLKVSTKGTGRTANSGQARVRQSEAIQQHVKDDRSRAPQPNNHKPFWNAGESSIGDTSDTPSAHEIQGSQNRFVSQDVNAAARSFPDDRSEGLPSEGDFNADGNDGKGEEDGDDVAKRGTKTANYDPRIWRLNARQRGIMGMEGGEDDVEDDGEEASFHGQVTLPYVEGDSYPSTTSGPPSMIEADGSRSFHAVPEHVTAPMPFQRRGQITAQHHQPGGHQQPAAQGRARHVPRAEQYQIQQDHSASRQFDRTLARPQEPTRQETNGAFTWEAGPRTRTSNRQPFSDQNPAVPAQSATKQASAMEHAEQGYPPQAERTQRQSHHVNPPKFDAKPPANREIIETAMRPTPRVSFEPQQAERLPAEGARPPIAQDQAQMSDSELHDEQKEFFEKEPSPETDFDVPELFDMDFSELKSQPFDVDPRDDSTGFSGIASDDSVEKQVATAAALQPKDQHAFFSSLPIDEWEQAGEWFLGKFGETLAKLKNLRQEKRKAARAFEKEIEGRHVAVAKKRKLTEDALDDMKKSGNMVLASTPKKAKMG